MEFLEYNHRIRVNPPKYVLGGTVMGDRTMNVEDAWVYHDETYGYKAVIIFNPIMKSGGKIWGKDEYAGKTDDFRGVIYHPDTDKTPSKSYKKFKDINDIKEPICYIEGSWIRNLIIDGKEYWNVDGEEYRPWRQIPNKRVLPSDWRFREDLLWLW